jgi:hypothetical protein
MDVYGLTLSTDAARGFLDWMRSPTESELGRLLRHPGYRAVVKHSQALSFAPVRPADFWNAINGHPSNLYGLRNVRDNACDIERLISYVQRNRTRLLRLVAGTLLQLFPSTSWQNTGLHCIVGYDTGIGLDGNVAINLNSPKYLNDNREIDFLLIHEAAHVAYERLHGAMRLDWMVQPGGLRRLVYTLLQNEGVAVYAALAPRRQAGQLQERDYLPLQQRRTLQIKATSLLELLEMLRNDQLSEAEVEEILGRLSDQRLSYVVGCHLFCLIEQQGGLEAVREAILMPAQKFVEEHLGLLRQLT